jgi:pyruvate/2-oxoglutarate dehydrogenase complex dihydrolipoamide acyltransferase (E2) component
MPRVSSSAGVAEGTDRGRPDPWRTETDKAVVEIPSPFAGTVLKLHFKPKDIVKVGQVLVTIGEKGEAVAEAPLAAAGVPVVAPAGVAPVPGPAVLATPAVRKLAGDLGLDLAAVPGTGPGGRITEEDVRGAKEAAGKKTEVRIKAKFDFTGSRSRPAHLAGDGPLPHGTIHGPPTSRISSKRTLHTGAPEEASPRRRQKAS